MTSHNLFAALLALSFFVYPNSADAGERAAASEARDRYVTIPVLYVTDRAPTKKGYGPQRKEEDLTSIDDLRYGWFDYALKTDKPISTDQTQLGWSEVAKAPKNELKMRPQAETANVRGFGQSIIDAAKKAGTDEVFVMVHGFNTPFARAATGAANLEKAVQRPVILYSWPSKGRLGQYGVDLGNNEWSQEHFDSLIDEIVRVRQLAGLKFNLVAHSMGNRLAVHSAPVLRGRHVFNQIFLVDPDFDAETFVHYLYRYGRKTEEDGTKPDTVEPTKVRILFSHKDRALPLSELVFGGYTRLGQAADTLLSSVVSPLSIPGKLGDAFNSGGAKKTASDVANNLTGNKPQWMMKFEWIDFTALDHGLIGHTVPYKLIANLWSTDQPGAGLKLVPGHNGAPNKLSSLFSNFFGEKDHISSKIVTAQRVVIDPK